MYKTVVQDGDAALNNLIDGDASLVEIIDGEGVCQYVAHSGAYPSYNGATEVTPNQSTQTLQTAFKSVLEDITINPIPDNYGSIDFDGSTLTVE